MSSDQEALGLSHSALGVPLPASFAIHFHVRGIVVLSLLLVPFLAICVFLRFSLCTGVIVIVIVSPIPSVASVAVAVVVLVVKERVVDVKERASSGE